MLFFFLGGGGIGVSVVVCNSWCRKEAGSGKTDEMKTTWKIRTYARTQVYVCVCGGGGGRICSRVCVLVCLYLFVPSI